MKGYLRIGDLARLGGVSVKALRFYDEQGLLRPEHVDPHTGYRYYTLDQTETLAAITNLRMVDFSIAEIAVLLHEGNLAPENVKKAIAIKRRELLRAQSDIANKVKLAEIMARALPADPANTLPVFRLASIEDQHVYSIERTTPHLGAPVTEMFEEAEAIVAEHDARAPTAPFLIFHDPPCVESQITVEVCIPLMEGSNDPPPITKIPGCDFACSIVYAGDYSKTEPLYKQMKEWIGRAGLKIAGPLRELYHRFGADQEDYRLPAKMIAKARREYLTELQIPVSLK